MKPFKYLEPKSLDEACSLLSEHKEEAKILAGGQSLMVLLKHRLIAPQYIIDIKGLRELEYINDGQDGIRIGALTPHRAVETSSLIIERFPILAETERVLASVQVRNWGTIGGSLCHADPKGDLAPGLIALGAKIKAVSVRGSREIALGEFFTDYLETVLAPDEILVEIQVPHLAPHTAGVYVKESVRFADGAIAGVAVVIRLDGGHEVVREARIVLGAVGPTPIRAEEAEKVLAGKKATSRLVEEVGVVAATEARPIADVDASAEYRREIVRVATRQAVSQAVKRAQAL